MPIASMLGSDSDRPPRETSTPSLYSRSPMPPMSTAPAPVASGKMSPPPAPLRQPQSEFTLFGRSHTPDRGVFSKPAGRPYRSESGPTAPSSSQPPAEDSRFGGLPRAHPVGSYGDKQAPQSPRSTYMEASYSSTNRRMSLGTPIQRPSSQPHHLPQPEEHPTRASLFGPMTRTNVADKGPGPQRTGPSYSALEGPQHPNFGGGPPETHSRELVNRDQELRLSQHAQGRYGSHFSDRDERQSRPPWESNVQRMSPEPGRYASGESASSYGFGSLHGYTKSLGSQPGAPRSISGPQLQPRQEAPPSQDSSPSASRRFPSSSRIFSSVPGPVSRPPSFGGSGTDEQHPPRTSAEEPLHHKTILNLNAENKRGRVSPLPQAVQGAQAQLIGLAGEPGIQSELGRVFSGIGSGVGVSSGPPTPLSSMKKDHLARPLSSEIGDNAKPGRSNSRRSRKVKDEEGKDEQESVNRGETIPVRGGGVRRGRHVHHHHRHAHQ